jgi:hypothetical protein
MVIARSINDLADLQRADRHTIFTPKPPMKRNKRGIARSDITYMIMCMLSGVRLMKSHKLSCADCACGKAQSGSSLMA